jgi:hypothetical protein
MYENGKMRTVETILRIGGRGTKENDGGVNSTKIYCKHFCKCHMYPQYNNNMIIIKVTEYTCAHLSFQAVWEDEIRIIMVPGQLSLGQLSQKSSQDPISMEKC